MSGNQLRLIETGGAVSPPTFDRLDRTGPWGFLEPMDTLTFFGLAAVTLMLVFYALEDWSPRFSLAFAGACPLGSFYGFL